MADGPFDIIGHLKQTNQELLFEYEAARNLVKSVQKQNKLLRERIASLEKSTEQAKAEETANNLHVRVALPRVEQRTRSPSSNLSLGGPPPVAPPPKRDRGDDVRMRNLKMELLEQQKRNKDLERELEQEKKRATKLESEIEELKAMPPPPPPARAADIPPKRPLSKIVGAPSQPQPQPPERKPFFIDERTISMFVPGSGGPGISPKGPGPPTSFSPRSLRLLQQIPKETGSDEKYPPPPSLEEKLILMTDRAEKAEKDLAFARSQFDNKRMQLEERILSLSTEISDLRRQLADGMDFDPVGDSVLGNVAQRALELEKRLLEDAKFRHSVSVDSFDTVARSKAGRSETPVLPNL